MFKTAAALSGVLATVYGIGYTLMPAFVNGLYMDANPQSIVTGRFFGVALLGFGLICWLLKDSLDAGVHRALSIAGIVSSVVGLLTSVIFTVNGTMSAFGWSAALIYVVLTVVWGMCYREGQSGA